MDLSGKVVIVTGSGRGLGLAYAIDLASHGAAVVVNDVDAEEIDEQFDAASGVTGQAIGVGGDRLAMWSHPGEVAVGFAGGTGWSADAIASSWPSTFAPAQQNVGQKLPEPPR